MANAVERTRTIYATKSHVDLVQAVGSCGGSLANLRCGGCFKERMWDQSKDFSSKPAVGEKSPDRWSRYAGGRLK